MAWEAHKIPSLSLGYSGGPLLCASISLNATQTASKEGRGFLCCVKSGKEKKKSSKL